MNEMIISLALFQNEADAHRRSSALEGDLTNAKHELLRVQEMLEMAEKVVHS